MGNGSTLQKGNDEDVSINQKNRDDNAKAKFFPVVKGLMWHAFKSNR